MNMRGMLVLVLSLITLILQTPRAVAALGEAENSVLQESKLMGAVHQKTPLHAYTTHEIKTPNTVIKEFVSPSGLVFAVTWRGVKAPDLSVLFGSYYSEYAAARSQQAPKGPGRRSSRLQTAHLEVRRGGHMRDIHGKAFVPSLVPAGVNVEALP